MGGCSDGNVCRRYRRRKAHESHHGRRLRRLYDLLCFMGYGGHHVGHAEPGSTECHTDSGQRIRRLPLAGHARMNSWRYSSRRREISAFSRFRNQGAPNRQRPRSLSIRLRSLR